MEGRYEIKGSNTLYKVWGIIIFVFAGIEVLLGVIGGIILLAGTSMVSPWFYGGFDETLATYTVLFSIIGFLLFVARLAVKVISGIVLIRDYIRSKNIFIGLAITYFVFAFFSFISMILSITMHIGALFAVYYLFVMAWHIATGVILLQKQKRAVAPARSNGKINFVPPTQAPAFGRIEGMFGECKGKIYPLNKGQVCKIGRDYSCHIRLEHAKVSRLHCTVSKLENGNYQITDHSFNGTFYANQKLQKGIATEVTPGELLVVGDADNVLKLV